MTRPLAMLAAASIFVFLAATLASTSPKRISFESRWKPVLEMTRSQWGIWSSGHRRSEAACSWVQDCRVI